MRLYCGSDSDLGVVRVLTRGNAHADTRGHCHSSTSDVDECAIGDRDDCTYVDVDADTPFGDHSADGNGDASASDRDDCPFGNADPGAKCDGHANSSGDGCAFLHRYQGAHHGNRPVISNGKPGLESCGLGYVCRSDRRDDPGPIGDASIRRCRHGCDDGGIQRSVPGMSRAVRKNRLGNDSLCNAQRRKNESAHLCAPRL